VKEEPQQVEHEIIFLTYKINRADDGLAVSLLSKKKVEGLLKSWEKEPTDAFILCKQIDKESNVLNEVSVANPLKRVVEYSDESGMLQKKMVQLDSAEFTVRMQFNVNTKSIVLETNNPKPRILLTHKP